MANFFRNPFFDYGATKNKRGKTQLESENQVLIAKKLLSDTPGILQFNTCDFPHFAIFAIGIILPSIHACSAAQIKVTLQRRRGVKPRSQLTDLKILKHRKITPI